MLWQYKKTIRYLLKKFGWRAVYNFLYIKSFVRAGGEGADNRIGKYILPILKHFPKLKPYITSYPYTIEIEITNKCNKKCLICEHTYWNEPNRDLTFDEFLKIINCFPKLKWVNLTGEGDAFLNKDYLKMIEYLKSKNICVYLVDSFDLIDESKSAKLIQLGVDGIWISMDSANKEIYEKIKIGCDFDKIIKNIKTLLQLKKKYKSPIPELCFRYIITKLNLDGLSKFVEFIAKLRDDYDLGEGSKIEFAGLLYFPEIEHLYLSEIPKDIVFETLATARKYGMHVDFSHPEHSSKLPAMHLCSAWSEPYIMMGGYVMPCCAVLMSNKRDFLRKYSLGNIFEQSFEKIWYSERYKKFRALISNPSGQVPILCQGCRAFNTLDREKKYGVSSEI